MERADGAQGSDAAGITAGSRRSIGASKLSAPALRPGIVDRPVLIDRLIAGRDSPIVLISAPAGYGKTTLVAIWRAVDERPFGWVSLDRTDNDPANFLAAVLRALDPIVGFDATLIECVSVADPPLEDVVSPALAEACIDSRRPFVLVLDDVHLVSEPRSLAALAHLAEHVPAGCQLVLATRIDPPLPIAGWRAHGRLQDVRAADLSLGEAEAGALLSAAGVSLNDGQIAQLVERTEGWAAALYLAALSLRDRDRPEEFVSRFAGTSRHVADFLSEDVLGRLPNDVTEFLLHTSILDELTASLCDAVTGRNDGDATLRELERTNLLVVPLDEERVTYRYHHLFAQYLRAELARRKPALVTGLHRRASQWHHEHGLIGPAVGHAQTSGDIVAAADLVSASWLPMVERGQVDTLGTWIAGFTDHQIEGHAPLAIAAAWSCGLTGERERALRFAEAARRGSWNGPMPDGTASLESALAIMSGAFGLGGLAGVSAAAQRALDLEPATSRWRPGALALLGQSLTLQGDFANARPVLDEVVESTGALTSTRATALAYLALVSVLEDDDEAAWSYATLAHDVVERPGMRNHMPSISTYSIVAHLLARRGDPDGTALALERANALLPRLTEAYWWQKIITHILLAPVLAGRGDEHGASTLLKEAEVLLEVHEDAGKLADWHAAAARKLGIASRRDHRSNDLSDAERRVLRLLASNLTLREIGRELFVSMNTVKSHVHAIYRKLGVSSRSDAVKAARSAALRAPDDSPG